MPDVQGLGVDDVLALPRHGKYSTGRDQWLGRLGCVAEVQDACAGTCFVGEWKPQKREEVYECDVVHSADGKDIGQGLFRCWVRIREFAIRDPQTFTHANFRCSCRMRRAIGWCCWCQRGRRLRKPQKAYFVGGDCARAQAACDERMTKVT